MHLQFSCCKFNTFRKIHAPEILLEPYDVIFWAAADEVGAQSKFDETTQVATLAPTVCSNEADDAFFAKAEIDVNGNLQQTVKLYRPYAQLNIGTDDLAAAAASGYTVTKTQVATQAYSAINLASGSVVGNASRSQRDAPRFITCTTFR